MGSVKPTSGAEGHEIDSQSPILSDHFPIVDVQTVVVINGWSRVTVWEFFSHGPVFLCMTPTFLSLSMRDLEYTVCHFEGLAF